MLKRLFDICVAATALVCAAPVLLILALWVRLDSPGPILFRQQRVGRGCQPFEMLKFRSMVADAPAKGPHFTAKGDPRITGSGRVLRKTSLDELPQLINVLKGDMSLVGPRPDVPAQEKDYAPADWQRRHQVRPGITGLAQATLRSAATPEQRLALDLQYVDSAGLWTDLNIILRTVAQVLGRGSH